MAKKSSNKADAAVGMDDDWRAESDARTLLQAGEIRKDRARLAKAKAWAKKQMAALTAVS